MDASASSISASISTFGFRGAGATGTSNFRSSTGTFVGFRRESQNSTSRAEKHKSQEAWRRKSVKVPKEGVYLRVANVMDILQQVRTFVGLVSNVWSWSMRTNSSFRQVMPGLVRVHTGVKGETFILQSYYLQDLDVLPLSRAAKTPAQRGEPPVTDVALKTPTKSFSQIKVLLKLRWLLRLHSACCELDYKMCSLRNIILGMQYVVLQECAEVACDSIFDTKVQQNVGAHLNLESVLDDIADQLYRSLGKAHKAFLEYVASCDPTRSVHFSQIDSPLTPPQVQSNEQLATALDTIFITNFLRQSQRESSCTLREFLDDLEALNLQAPEIPPLNGAQYLRAWALAKTKPSPESRQKGLGEDMVKLAQLDAVLLCAAIELHSPEVQASENELQDRRLIVNVPENPSSAVGGAPEPINFGSTGRKPGVSPTNAKIMYVERPQLSPAIIDAVIHVIQHHFTFPEGIRLRLHRLLFDEYGLTTEQAQNVEIAATTNIDGKRLTEDVLWSIDQKEKARLRKYFVDTGKDTSHLLAPSLVPSPWMQGKLAKYAESKKVDVRPPFSSTFPKLSMARSLPDFKAQPFKVPLGTGPLTYSPELKQFRSTGFFMKMPPL